MSLTGRHPSSPSLNKDDDRHYQNVSFHQGTQDPRMGSQRGGRPPIFSNMNSGFLDQRPVSAFMQREEQQGAPEHIHRPMSQQNLRPDPRFEDLRKRDERLRYNGHQQQLSQSMPMGPPVFPPHGQMRPQIRGGPLKFGPGYTGGQMSTHGSVPAGQMSPLGQMPPHQGGYYPQSPVANVHPSQMSPQYANSPHGKYPPPTAPKPNRGSGNFDGVAPEKPNRMLDGRMNGPPRPPLPDDMGKRDSPPPPPPPTSTHPLLQSPKGSGPSWEEFRKKEMARQWRDEQISALESREKKTPQEEERMKTLRLEREFQLRAEAEAAQRAEDEDDEEEEEQEDEEDNEVEGEQQQRRLENEKPAEVNHHHWLTQEGVSKADEIRRKQQELEAAKEAEEHILREAQRRREEEMRHRHRASQRLDSLLGANATDEQQQLQRSNGTSPLPPERGSSYSIMQQQSPSAGSGAPVKRVQFSENSHHLNMTYDNNANQEKIREDPNNFINDAENLLNLSPNRSGTGNTPGVIGAQEVYRDPRQRRLMEQAQKAAAATKSSGPEKLTFREKMKMFAMETEDSPKDKMKTSKAQREIEQ